MPIHVKVVSAANYSQWVGGEMKKMAAKMDDPAKVWALEDIVKRGEKVYAANCAACHQANGKGAGSIKALDGSQIPLRAIASETLNIAARCAFSLDDFGVGFSSFNYVISYTKNNWSNKTGQVVQPADVVALRK